MYAEFIVERASRAGITQPITKHNYYVDSVRDLPRIIKEAFYIASSGRPGPVLIDIPLDISKNEVKSFHYPKNLNLPGYNSCFVMTRGLVLKTAKLINQSK
ncbi:MAG: acetolactate synthase catalytic subunit, partial [Candidatus Infernicultor aquiphilus]